MDIRAVLYLFWIIVIKHFVTRARDRRRELGWAVSLWSPGASCKEENLIPAQQNCLWLARSTPDNRFTTTDFKLWPLGEGAFSQNWFKQNTSTHATAAATLVEDGNNSPQALFLRQLAVSIEIEE
jgi:hypothetical protein